MDPQLPVVRSQTLRPLAVPPHPALIGFVEGATRSGRLPAVAAGIWQEGQGPMLATRGRRSASAKVAVTDSDRWHIGSITKSMTALLLMRLGSRQGVTLETPLADLVGLPLHETLKPVTLRLLLAHRAGLTSNPPTAQAFPRHGPVTHGAAHGPERDAMIAPFLLKPVKPGKHSYSNIGYMLAGHIAERLGANSYEALMRAEIAAPLGLASFGFGPPRGQGPLDEPLGHRSILGFFRRPVPCDSIRADLAACLAPAGLVHLSMGDLLSYGAAVLRLARGEDGIISAASFADLTRSPDDYAGGWVKGEEPWSNGPFLGHNGSNQRWYADLTILPGKGRVLAFATNVFGLPGFGAAMRWRGIAAVRDEVTSQPASGASSERSEQRRMP
ncbi:MAG: serine hydrolase domain-containing protein [Pannonibacter sp.]